MAAAIALPVFRQNVRDAVLFPPQAPDNPPTNQDVASGIYLAKDTYLAFSEFSYTPSQLQMAG
jgi:hypothetical protein